MRPGIEETAMADEDDELEEEEGDAEGAPESDDDEEGEGGASKKFNKIKLLTRRAARKYSRSEVRSNSSTGAKADVLLLKITYAQLSFWHRPNLPMVLLVIGYQAPNRLG